MKHTELAFPGVRCGGDSKETRGVLKLKFGDDWEDLGVHFVDSIPIGWNMIIGLDNQLSRVGIKLMEAQLGTHEFVFHAHEDISEEMITYGGKDAGCHQ